MILRQDQVFLIAPFKQLDITPVSDSRKSKHLPPINFVRRCQCVSVAKKGSLRALSVLSEQSERARDKDLDL